MIVDTLNTGEIVLPQIAQERLNRLGARTARIGVIGLGYVGLPLCLLLSEAGFKVTGFDSDAGKVADLEAGRSYIFRIPPTEIQSAQRRGFAACTGYAQLSDQDAIIMCVPTPLTEHREPDLSFVENTARATAPWIREGQLVVLESTTYPGTTEELIIPILEAGNLQGLKVQGNGKPAERGVFYVAFSPEREDPGNDTVARRDIPKVVGGHERIATELAAVLYEGIFARSVRVSSTRVAEMTKVAGKYLPLRQYRSRQRTEAAFAAHGGGYMGGYRCRGDEALRVSSVLSGAWSWRTLHSDRSVLSELEGQAIRFQYSFH